MAKPKLSNLWMEMLDSQIGDADVFLYLPSNSQAPYPTSIMAGQLHRQIHRHCGSRLRQGTLPEAIISQIEVAKTLMDLSRCSLAHSLDSKAAGGAQSPSASTEKEMQNRNFRGPLATEKRVPPPQEGRTTADGSFWR